MKKIQLILLGLIVVFAISCKGKANSGGMDSDSDTMDMDADSMEMEEEKSEGSEVKSITFEMEAKSDSGVSGEVTFTEENGNVVMKANLVGLSEGEHAIHIHEKADCSSPDGKSTGGHWNPTFQPHGKWGAEEGYHKGDIGNFVADADGNATIDFATKEWCIDCDDETKNIVGKAVIVHQGVDDYTSQPSGAAGARVACTGIIQ